MTNAMTLEDALEALALHASGCEALLKIAPTETLLNARRALAAHKAQPKGTAYAWIGDKLRELGHADLAESADWAHREMEFLRRELSYERERRAKTQAPAPSHASPAGWVVRDRSDIEPGAIDIEGPGRPRMVLTRDHESPALRTLYMMASAMLGPAPSGL